MLAASSRDPFASHRSMTDHDSEICGFLDVKYLGDKCKTQRARKRALTPWKVWRRHWCSARKLGPGLGIKIQLDCGLSSSNSSNSSSSSSGSSSGNGTFRDKNKSVIIPPDAIICRARSRSKQFAFGVFPPNERKPLLYLAGTSEIESQRWMANMRHLLRPRKHRFALGAYSISMVDNAHSKASGLTGLYGDLIASATGVFIKDVHTGEIRENFEWREFDQFHLISAGRPEDVKCICVIHTTKEYRGGVGELHIFCLDAGRLLRELAARGRGPKEKQIDRRPLSLSEGDLRVTGVDSEKSSRDCLTPTGCAPINPLNPNATHLFVNAEPWLSHKSFEQDNWDRATVNSVGGSLENYGKPSENLYQPEPASIPNVHDEPRGRMSAISTGSGIYEEISDDTENLAHVNSPAGRQEPPPLPPRQKRGPGGLCTINVTENSDAVNDISSSAINSKCNSLIVNGEKMSIPEKRVIDTCNYVPMSPRLKDVTLQELRPHSSLQENDYVIMR